MERELAKQKLQEALEGMTREEKFQALLDVLDEREVVLIPSWILGNAAVGLGAKKVVVTVDAKKHAYQLQFVAGRGKVYELTEEETIKEV